MITFLNINLSSVNATVRIRPPQRHQDITDMKCEFCKIWLPIIAILVAGFYVAYQFVPAAAPSSLRIATGSKEGAYYQYAQEYQQRLKKEGVDLIIQTTAGSVEVLQLLQDGKVDLGFVQGGVANDNAKETLHSIASLFYEPLWVFYRKDLKTINYLQELRGKRLAIGQEGSGSRALISQLLTDNGITADNTTLLGLNVEDARKQLENGEIDAAFFVMSPKAEVISVLASNADIAIMNFQRHAKAYTSRYPFLSSLIVGEGLLDLQKNIPEKETVLLSATAALVAVKDLHSDPVRLLSREAIYIHNKPGMFEKARQFPSIEHLEIPIHPDAEQYLQQGPSWLENIFPFSIASKLDQLKILLIPLIALLIPLFKSILPLYNWRIRSKTYRWYKELNEVDRQLDSFDYKVIDQEIDKLTKLHSALAKEVTVPLSHMSEFYELRTHTDHILNRLKERQVFLISSSDSKEEINRQPDSVLVADKTAKVSVISEHEQHIDETAHAYKERHLKTQPSPEIIRIIGHIPKNVERLSPTSEQLDNPSDIKLAQERIIPERSASQVLATTSQGQNPRTNSQKKHYQAAAKDTISKVSIKQRKKATCSKLLDNTAGQKSRLKFWKRKKQPLPEKDIQHNKKKKQKTRIQQSLVWQLISKLWSKIGILGSTIKQKVNPLNKQTQHTIDESPQKITNIPAALKQLTAKVNLKLWKKKNSKPTPSAHTDTQTTMNAQQTPEPKTTSHKDTKASTEIPNTQDNDLATTRLVTEKTPATDKERHQQANRIVRKHMAAAMAFSVIPVPLLDVAALTGTQLNLLHSLSDHYSIDFDKKKGRSLLVSMLGGSLPTTAIMGLSSLTKVVPGIGTIGGSASLSALSAAMIYATGHVFIRHFENGGKLHDFDVRLQRQPFQQAVKSGLAINANTMDESAG